MVFPAILLLELVASTWIQMANAQSDQLCGDWQTYNPPGLNYTFENDVWADDGSGQSCISVDKGGTIFNVTWQWSDHDTNVHSYPHIGLVSDTLPVTLSSLSSLQAQASWAMSVADSPSIAAIADSDLMQANAKANVAIDMFLATNPADANSSHTAQYEVMIWFLAIPGVQSVGYSSSNAKVMQHQYTINQTNFYLSYGDNGKGLTTYTWLPTSNVTDIKADYQPLLQYLWQIKMIPKSLYLGALQFGTETFHSDADILFTVRDFDFNVTSDPSYHHTPLNIPPSQSSAAAGPTIPRFLTKTLLTTKIVCGVVLAAFWTLLPADAS